MSLTGEEKKAYQREYMKKKRKGLTKGLTKSGSNTVGLTEGVTRKPLIHLSDGQVFDPNIDMPMRVPAGWSQENRCHAMANCNRGLNMKPLMKLTPEQTEDLKTRYNLSHDDKGNWRPPTKEEIAAQG